MYKKIAVPVDGSELAEQALPIAVDLAKRLSSSIVLIAVLDKVEATGPDTLKVLEGAGIWTGVPRIALEPAPERLRNYLKKVAGRLDLDGRVTEVVREGDSASEIVAAATEEGAGMIVMTTRGRTGVARGLLGSVADRVVHSSTIPTLLVRAAKTKKRALAVSVKHVILPLDGSKRAEAAIPHAKAVAKAYDAEIVIVRAVSMPSAAYVSGPYPYPHSYYDDLRADLMENAEAYLKGVSARVKRGGYSVRSVGLHGGASEQIVDIAKGEKDAIVVMTTRGHTGFQRWVLGSVADAVVHSATVPVLLVEGSLTPASR